MRFVRETQIQASPAEVFAFHESPGALQRLTPDWEPVRVESGGQSIEVGSRVTIVMKMGPFPMRWVAEHTAYVPPRLFEDRQVSGPFASWVHRHEFEDNGQGGTLLRDTIDYEPPLGWLGRLLSSGFIEAKLKRLFDFRHAQTKAIVESGDFQRREKSMIEPNRNVS